jgi:hypothetical protein
MHLYSGIRVGRRRSYHDGHHGTEWYISRTPDIYVASDDVGREIYTLSPWIFKGNVRAGLVDTRSGKHVRPISLFGGVGYLFHGVSREP